MENLPPIVLLNILDFLSLKDRCSFAQISDKCSALVSSKSLWREVVVAITDDEVLLSVGKSPPQPISDMADYSEKYAQCVHSLTLIINVQLANDQRLDGRLCSIVSALKTENLKKFNLSFERAIKARDFQKIFLESRSASERARIICGLPSHGLLIVRSLCQNLPLCLKKVSWMYSPKAISDSPGFVSSLSLKFAAKDRMSDCVADGKEATRPNVFSCSRLAEFETNVYSDRLIAKLASAITSSGLTFVLVFDDATLQSSQEPNQLTEEECRRFRMVLRVTALTPAILDKLRQLPEILPIKTLRLKAENVDSTTALRRVVQLVERRFRSSLEGIDVNVNRGAGNLQQNIVNYIQKTFPKLTVSVN